MILQKKGYPPVDVELSKKLTPPSGLIAFLKTKGLKATHKNRDFYEIGWDQSFEKHIGMTPNEFYDSWYNFMTSDEYLMEPPLGFYPDGPLSDYVDFKSK